MSSESLPSNSKRARITIWWGPYRRDAEFYATQERERYPDSNVVVTGEQGHWKVRRDIADDHGREGE